MLDAKQLRRAAREARKLAFEVLGRTAPKLHGWDWCGCACAIIARRAHLPGARRKPASIAATMELDNLLPSVLGEEWRLGLLSKATMAEVGGETDDVGVLAPPLPGALVFPLLSAADELEIAAKGRPQKAP